jgi:hypothetical protein
VLPSIADCGLRIADCKIEILDFELDSLLITISAYSSRNPTAEVDS